MQKGHTNFSISIAVCQSNQVLSGGAIINQYEGDMVLIPVILAGGSGDRLWPLSRQTLPKQFLSMTGNVSMFQQTIERAIAVASADPLVVCHEEHRFLAAEILRQMNLTSSQILLEPIAKNTMPAIALAALYVMQNDTDPLLLILPSDHKIDSLPIFKETVEKAKQLAEKNYIVTFGITPTKPATGYGYIEKGLQDDQKLGFQVRQFHEKPTQAHAERMLASQSFLWNSGIFLAKASIIIHELKQFHPNILKTVTASLQNITVDENFLRPDKDIYETCHSISIDYAIMEKTQKCAVVPLNTFWSDLGNWHALWEACDKDEHQNVIHGNVQTQDTNQSFIHGDKRLITTLGVSDLIVVDTQDALLIAHQTQAEALKKITEPLKAQNAPETKHHAKVLRPWGWYHVLTKSHRFLVKRIQVEVNKSLSLQKHHHRSEHWVVVKGTAEVTRGSEVFLLSENESTYIPIGMTHRLKNIGKIPLEIIEVQSGSYLDEDDIIRLDDEHGRITHKEQDFA